MTWRRWAGRAAAGALVAVLALAALLAGEVWLARRGPVLDGAPLRLDGRIGAGDGEPLRMVWLGDSTAAGVGVDRPSDALPVQVAAALGRPVELTVLAVSGDRVADVVDDQLPAVAGLDPDVVVISVGANDVTGLTDAEDFRRRYRRLVDGLPRDATVVALGVPDMGSIPRLAQPLRAVAGFRGRQLDEIVRDVAAATGARYVPIAAATGPAFRREPERLFAADRYHPSAAGYELWAAAVVAALPCPAMCG